MKFIKFIVILIFILVSLSAIHAQEAQRITVTTVDLNVRAAPSTSSKIITKVSANTEIVAEARNETSDWILGRTWDGSIRGWLSVAYLTLNFAVGDLPLSQENFNNVVASGETVTSTTLGNLLSGGVIRRSYQIFARGQDAGQLPNVVIKVGDSNNAGNQFNPAGYSFLCPFVYNAYDLGEYSVFQKTIYYFGGSLCGNSPAAQNGFTTGNMLDKNWSESMGCSVEDTLIGCTAKLYKPSVAIIYFGLGDLVAYDARQFRHNMNEIVEILIENGVIPVLTTFTIADEHPSASLAPAFNSVIRTVSSVYLVPLVEFQRPSAKLPNQGTVPDDGYHLAYRWDGVVAFNGDETLYGGTLRHFLTLRVLYELHTRVMGG